MKKLKSYLILMIIVGILTACSKSQPESTQYHIYTERALRIGVVGKIPEIREEQVKFEQIQFNDLKKNAFASQYDAVFIVQDNINDSVPAKYTTFCKESEIPFFFINMEHSSEDLTYAMGFLYKDDSFNSWGYGLYKNIENEANIKIVYSQIFGTIYQNTLPKK